MPESRDNAIMTSSELEEEFLMDSSPKAASAF